MSHGFSTVGRRLAQPDGVAKATGTAKFASDLRMSGMLIGKVLRSPYAHANIKKIDKAKAKLLPGVEAVISCEDVTMWKRFSRGFTDLPLLPGGHAQPADEYILNDTARHCGDAVAAVAAINEHVAEAALELIEVEYEELPFVIDPEEAMKPGAPQIHDFAHGNIYAHMTYPLSSDDVEQAFRAADCIVEGTFSTSKQAHCTLETGCAVASPGADGKLTVWSQCQLAHFARRELAHIFNLPVGKVRVVSPFIGGRFGQGSSLGAEALAAALALKTGKPVKVVNTREEDFTVPETRTPAQYSIKMGFKKDGSLVAMQMYVLGHLGAYVGRGPRSASFALNFGLEHYRCPNRAGEADMVLTNTTPSGAMRGIGNTSVMWCIEQLVDEAAKKLGIDPLELRLKNIKKTGEISAMGVPITSSYLEQCIERGAVAIGWKTKRQEKPAEKIRRGVGMATMTHCSGVGPLYFDHSNAFIKLNEDGSANLLVHPAPLGTHIWGTLSQIAAEELGLSAEDIHVATGDTDITMFDVGSGASRSLHRIGHAVVVAARQAKEQLLKQAARVLAVPPEELDSRERQIYVKAHPERTIPIAEVCRDVIYNHKEECFNISGKYSAVAQWNSPPMGAFFAEVAVDTETGEVQVLRFVTAMDCGRAINPMTVEGQMEGGLAQGLGFALSEDYIINKDTGVVASDNFTTYKIPGTLDMPETEMIIIDEPDPKGPFGAKGVGEAGIIGVAPAIGNAIYDAIGVRISDLPVTPEKVLEALKKKGYSHP